MSKMIAMAIPIIKGKENEWREFVNELRGARRDDFIASRKRLGIRERTFLQHSPMGDLCIVTLEGNDPEKAFQQFGQEQDSFARWFMQKVKEIHNLDLSQPPKSPLPELLVDSEMSQEYAVKSGV